MILRSAPPSPFGRKVKIAAALLGFELDVQATDTNNPSDTVRQQNPLGKIPVLIDGGETYYDSRVILEYLDVKAGGGRIIPLDAKPRFAALRLQALCDGMMDASILQMYEGRFRPAEMKVQSWLDYQQDKIARGLKVLEAAPPKLGPVPDVGQIALACALGYRDIRFNGTWRDGHPRLVEWLDKFSAAVPSFAKTNFVP